MQFYVMGYKQNDQKQLSESLQESLMLLYGLAVSWAEETIVLSASTTQQPIT